MEGYSVQIIDGSRELTLKERVKMKDLSDAFSIDEITKDGPVLLDVESYVELEIHNEKSDNKDYEVLVIITKDGNKYKTGSQSFHDSFMGIWDEMKNATDEPWELKVYRLESKNYKGKDFLTCTVE